jgi:hypothetical protein
VVIVAATSMVEADTGVAPAFTADPAVDSTAADTAADATSSPS